MREMSLRPGVRGPAEPLVAVVIPALNEAGKIGRVLDKLPRDGRFEAIVVDDGSTDGTGDEARAHGAAIVIRHEQRGGVGAAIRDGWKEAMRAIASTSRCSPVTTSTSPGSSSGPSRRSWPGTPTTCRVPVGCQAEAWKDRSGIEASGRACTRGYSRLLS